MRLLVLILLTVSSCAWSAELLADIDGAFQADRKRLEDIFREQCEASQIAADVRGRLNNFDRPPGRTLVFLSRSPAGSLTQSPLNELCKKYAQALVRLGGKALDQGADATLVYQLLQQAAAFDGASQARRILGRHDNRPVQARLANTNHPRLHWKRKQYWRVSSKHYQVVTNRSAEDGAEIARRLEDLYCVWQQLFFECWSDPSELQTAWQRSRALVPKSSRKHRVVLFESREQYVNFLRARQSRIEISLGFYDVDSETSFFFAGPDSSASTQIHEATHQLFHEATSTPGKLTMKHNFWAIEGIAMYMESMQLHDITASLGGLDANRLQFARYRCLQEQFYLPLADLVAMGRDELQLAPRIRRIYSQSAGLIHFLMDGQGGKYRAGLIRYLRAIYRGHDRIDTLVEATGTPLAQLDREYRAYLDVSDEDLNLAQIRPDSLRSLCLGATSVSDKGLKAIPKQSKLKWLDLARTSATDAGLGFIATGSSLEQLNLHATSITDQTLELIAASTRLEELDLSNTGITDGGLKHLVLLPRLRVLWLDGTGISDKSVELLSRLKALEQLGISNTKVTDQGRKRLRTRFPMLAID